MSTIGRRRRALKPVDQTTALELLISALTYVKLSGLDVRADNISSGVAIVISKANIDPAGSRIVPIEATTPTEVSADDHQDRPA